MILRLAQYIENFLPDTDHLPPERRAILDKLIQYCLQRASLNKKVNLLFICTHNSRRSHFSQIWAQIAAHYYGFEEVETFSGGTEATAFNERAVAAIARAGMQIEHPGGENPAYQIRYGDQYPSIVAYSKKYDAPSNPGEDFCAVMTCSSADADCPVIPGAESRIPLLYVDPKVSDGTAQEQSTYDERCLQIAKELFYVWREVKNRL